MAYDEQLADRIRSAIGAVSGVSEQKMFGGLAFLVNGNMAVAASSEGGLMVRCDPMQTGALLREPGARPFEMRGRQMDGWLRVDRAEVADDAALLRWVRTGLDYASRLPSK
jgi:TfoX/Sxy family transcriptional regulator of competence genes